MADAMEPRWQNVEQEAPRSRASHTLAGTPAQFSEAGEFGEAVRAQMVRVGPMKRKSMLREENGHGD